jgi:hypothetical protein
MQKTHLDFEAGGGTTTPRCDVLAAAEWTISALAVRVGGSTGGNNMRAKNKFVCLIAVLLAAFAVSANAAKTITLTNSTTAGQAPFLGVTLTTGTVYVQLNNTGNSNASSLELDWTNTPQFTVNSATINTSKGVLAGTLITGQTTPGSYKGVVFTFTLPQKSAVVIALNVTVNAGTTCGSPQITWQPYAWTGGVGTPSSSFSAPPLGAYTSNLPGAANCSLSFLNQPMDAFVGSVITTAPFNSTAAPVKVQAMQGSTAVSGVSVSIGSTGGSCSISGSATTDSGGNATLTSISSSAAGADCQLTAAAAGFTSATSNAFDVVQQQGTLSCDPNDPNNAAGNLNPDAIPPLGDPDWGLKRGLNTDNTCGANVPFTLTVNGDDNSAHFLEDSLGQPTSVEYIIRWKTVPVDSDKWSAKQPCVSWGIPDPVYGEDANGICVGDYVPALACVSNNVSGGTAVMPAIPNTYPFNDVVEGSYPQYQPTTPAKVCIAQQGWTSDGSVPGVQYWHKFIDQADTGIRLP